MRASGLLAGALAALALLSPWAARAGDVISARPDTVAVTIYRDEAIPNPAAAAWAGYGLAMINETRLVDLPAGQSRVVFQGVADGTLPQTAVLKDLPGRVVEQNFDFDLLGPGSLIGRSVGRNVQVIRTNPKTGQETAESAVLRAGPDGAVLDFGGRVEALQCGGPPERLVFADVPQGLNGRAALSTTVRVERAGRYRLRLAYLTVGLAWKADYVARVAPDGQHLDLAGWITLANHDGASFVNAPTSVVAGRLAREAVELARRVAQRRTPGCWPMGNSHHPRGETKYLAEAEEPLAGRGMMAFDRAMRVPAPMMAMAPPPPPPPPPPRAKESDLGDYKLYTLDEPTTVAARQTKQVLFLSQADVAFDTVYVVKAVSSQPAQGREVRTPAETTLRLENKAAKGLGRALPAGAVSVRQRQGAGPERFIGEPQVRDVPVGEPFELVTGQASDVQVAWRITDVQRYAKAGRRGVRITVQADATNAKGRPVVAEFRDQVAGRTGYAIVAESQGHGTKAGDPVWTLALPANGEASLTFTAEYLAY